MPGLEAPGPGWLMVGASGRVGRLVRASWMRDPAIAMRLVPQMRGDPVRAAACGGLWWAPLDGPEMFEQFVNNDGSPAAMIMLAGVIPGRGTDFATNVDLAVTCLEAARAARCDRVLIASSAAVYGASDDGPLPEDARCAPDGAYGASKLAMETACAPYRALGMDVCCLRIGNVVGADALLRNAAPGRAIRITRFGDGQGPRRPYIGPESLARILATLAAWPGRLPDVLNVAAPLAADMADLAQAAGLGWSWEEAPAEALQKVALDCRRLGDFYQFTPEECTLTGMMTQFRRSVEWMG